MPTPSEVVRACLVDLELVRVPGVDVAEGTDPGTNEPPYGFANSLPDVPDRCVAIVPATGRSRGKDMRGKGLSSPAVRVIVRWELEKESEGYDFALSLAAALDAVSLQTVHTSEDDTDHFVQQISRRGPISRVGEEPGRRLVLWSVDADVIYQAQEPAAC